MESMNDKPLHVQVAEALGWTYISGGECGWEGEPPSWDPLVDFPRRPDQHIGVPRYDTDWSATGPLIDEYEVRLQTVPRTTVKWRAVRSCDPYNGPMGKGVTPLAAVCHLILELGKDGKL